MRRHRRRVLAASRARPRAGPGPDPKGSNEIDVYICPVCGEDRDSEDCCGWCLSCQDDIADFNEALCIVCADADEPALSDDEYHYRPDDED